MSWRPRLCSEVRITRPDGAPSPCIQPIGARFQKWDRHSGLRLRQVNDVGQAGFGDESCHPADRFRHFRLSELRKSQRRIRPLATNRLMIQAIIFHGRSRPPWTAAPGHSRQSMDAAGFRRACGWLPLGYREDSETVELSDHRGLPWCG